MILTHPDRELADAVSAYADAAHHLTAKERDKAEHERLAAAAETHLGELRKNYERARARLIAAAAAAGKNVADMPQLDITDRLICTICQQPITIAEQSTTIVWLGEKPAHQKCVYVAPVGLEP